MKIYTRSGDQGMTQVHKGRVKKSSTRIHVEGNLDELNSYIGLTISKMNDSQLESLKKYLIQLQSILFDVSYDIYNPTLQLIHEEHIQSLEKYIDEFFFVTGDIKYFILPGGHEISAYLHVARTICRRAERYIVELSDEEEINELALKFINRLSDYLFAAARYVNYVYGIEDISKK